MVKAPSPARAWLVTGNALCGLAVIALAVSIISFVPSVGGVSAELASHPRGVELPTHRTYGIYVNDPNNSGYSLSCSGMDADGHELAFRDAPWTLTTSDTESLELIFDTGAGRLSIACTARGGTVRVGPVPEFRRLAVGLLSVCVFAGAGILTIVVSRRRKTSN